MQSGSSSPSGRNRGAAVEADAIGEQQLKRTQSGSSSPSGRNRGGAVEIGEQQSKRTQSGSCSRSGRNRRAAVGRADAIGGAVEIGEEPAEADAIGEQQLCTESCPAPDYSRRRTRGK